MNRQVTFPLNGIRKDNFGNWEPLLVENELVTISTDEYTGRLDERPSDGLVAPSTSPPVVYAIDGTGGYTVALTRTTSPSPSANEFYVNYTTATLSFNSSRAGETVRAVYYKIGSVIAATEINVIADRLTSNGGTPSATDDEYNIGSVWYDYVSDQMYLCLDNTDDSALWAKTGTSTMSIDSSGRETGITVVSNGNIEFWNLGIKTATMDCNNHVFIHEFTNSGYVKTYANGQLYAGTIAFSDLNFYANEPIYLTTDASANYINHRATSGAMHIPTDGTTGDALQWYADGTASWVHPSIDVNLLPNSWNIICSQRAIKTYVDAQIAGVNFWVRSVIGSHELTPRDISDRVAVGQFRVNTFTTAGIIKNSSSGDFSGGNSINVADFEEGFALPVYKGGTSLSTPPQYGDIFLGNSLGRFDLVNLQSLVVDWISIYGGAGDATVAGTSNQITVVNSDSTVWTLSTPQDIHTSASPTFASMTITATLTVGGGYGSTGATISSLGVGQFDGNLTTDGSITAALSASIGGGYGSTGATISSLGVGQFDGNLTTGGDLVVNGGGLDINNAEVNALNIVGAGYVYLTIESKGTDPIIALTGTGGTWNIQHDVSYPNQFRVKWGSANRLTVKTNGDVWVGNDLTVTSNAIVGGNVYAGTSALEGVIFNNDSFRYSIVGGATTYGMYFKGHYGFTFDTDGKKVLTIAQGGNSVFNGTVNPQLMVTSEDTTAPAQLTISSPVANQGRMLTFAKDGTSRWDITTEGVTEDGHYEGELSDVWFERVGGLKVVGYEDDGTTYNSRDTRFPGTIRHTGWDWNMSLGRRDPASFQVTGDVRCNSIVSGDIHQHYEYFTDHNYVPGGFIETAVTGLWAFPSGTYALAPTPSSQLGFVTTINAPGYMEILAGELKCEELAPAATVGEFNGWKIPLTDDSGSALTELVAGGYYDIRFKIRFPGGAGTPANTTIINDVRMGKDLIDYTRFNESIMSAGTYWSDDQTGWQYFRVTFRPMVGETDFVNLYIGRTDNSAATGTIAYIDIIETILHSGGDIATAGTIMTPGPIHLGACRLVSGNVAPVAGDWEAGKYWFVPGDNLYIAKTTTGGWLKCTTSSYI